MAIILVEIIIILGAIILITIREVGTIAISRIRMVTVKTWIRINCKINLTIISSARFKATMEFQGTCSRTPGNSNNKIQVN